MNLKEALAVQAGRADLRRGGAYHNVAAVTALPHFHFALFKNLRGLHIAQKRPITLLMALLYGRYQT